MWPFSTRSLLILLAILAFVHFGLPLLADLFFELYHLVNIDALYSVYGALRFGTAQYMFWPYRWVVTLAVALFCIALLWLRQKMRDAKAAAA